MNHSFRAEPAEPAEPWVANCLPSDTKIFVRYRAKGSGRGGGTAWGPLWVEFGV